MQQEYWVYSSKAANVTVIHRGSCELVDKFGEATWRGPFPSRELASRVGRALGRATRGCQTCRS